VQIYIKYVIVQIYIKYVIVQIYTNLKRGTIIT
jgi:hypothetical protein